MDLEGLKLYRRAISADDHYGHVCQGITGHNRFELTRKEEAIPLIQDAKRDKMTADDEWLKWMRAHY